MNPRALAAVAVGLTLLPGFGPSAAAQSDERIRGTWKGPDAALITSILKNRAGGQSPSAAARPRVDVLKFTPAGDSGVAKSLADAFGGNDAEKTALAEAFGQIKQGYEAEAAKKGMSNNLAAAMTFFIVTNVAAYHRSDIPSDEATDTLFGSLQETMAAVPAFAGLSNAEKQRIHDWLVMMGGFVLTGYVDAKQKGDQAALKTLGELADYSMRLVLGVEAGKLSLAGGNLTLAGAAAAAAQPTPRATENRVVGVWSISASSPATGNLVANAGYYKGQYQFKPDGTYSFKSERWFGHLRSEEFYTTEESGTYSVSGDSLTVSPKASRTTLRNPEGVVQKTQNNPLERVTYKWQLHHFEGLNETQLILQPPHETARDGGFSSNSLFPNSYLYSPGAKPEWRY